MRKLSTNFSLATKSVLFVFVVMLLAWQGRAQLASTYNFSSALNTYNTTLTGATTIIPQGWSGQVANVRLPFVFYYNGKGYSSIWVNSNGFITFGATAPNASINNPLATNNGFDGSVSGFGLVNPGASAGLVDAANLLANAITYGTQSSGGNTVFVIQWGNAWRYPTRPAGGTDNIRFQIRLVENTNVVEIMYGTCSTNIGYTFANLWSPVVGLGGASTTDFNNRSQTATGAWTTSSSSPGSANSDYMLFTSGGSVPPSGLTMTWTPTSNPTPLTGVPPVATAVANTGVACSAVSLGLANLPNNTGLTYQWQKSATGLAGSFVNCVGGGNTSASYTETPSGATYYRCIVTGGSGATASRAVAVGWQSTCPVLPTYTQSQWYNTESGGFGLEIASVVLPNTACGTGLSDTDPSSSGTTQGYTTGTCTNYIDLTYLTPMKLEPNTTYSGGSMTSGWTNAMNAKIYIDFNDDGLFTGTGELVGTVTGIINTATNNVSITIPALGSGAFYGLHRMRVRAGFATVTAPTGLLNSYGMAKDYMVSVVPPNQTIAPSIASPLCLPVASETFTSTPDISLGTAVGKTYTYTWTGPSAFTTTAISNSNSMAFTPTSTSYSGVYSVVATANGSQGCNTATYNLVVATSTTAPTAAPTALTISGVTYQGATINFTPAVTVPDGYLVVATNSATAPTAPVSGTTYTTGSTGVFGANSIVLNGSVSGSAPSYTTALLNSNSLYYIYIYPFNIDCSGPKYYTAAPALGGNTVTTCLAPATTLTATAPTGSTINLNWTAAVNGGNAGTVINPATFAYTVHAYLDAGLTVEAAGYPVNTTGTAYVATGLGVGTAYYFVVTSTAVGAVCGTNSNVATNTTTCTGTASVPYIQKFETGSSYGNLSPNCWTGNAGQSGGVGGEYKNGGAFGSPFTPRSGQWYYMFMGNNYVATTNQWLKSPGFALTPGTYTFSFWYVTNSQWSTIKAEYTTDASMPSNASSDMTGFTLIGTPPNNFNVGAWTKYTGQVTITSAGTYYFGINAVMGAAPLNLQLAIEDISLCKTPNVVASAAGPYCSPATVNLSTAGTTDVLSYSWTGTGGYTSSVANPSVPGVTSGVYSYTVTGVADPISAGFDGACAASAVTTTTVSALPSAVVPSATPSPVCVGDAITLTGGVTGGFNLQYAWSGPTTGIGNASAVNTSIATAVLANTGTFSLTVTAPGCTGNVTGTSVITVNQLPSAVTPSVTPNPVCVGSLINLNGGVTGGSGLVYAWSGNTTGISNAAAMNTTIPTAVLGNAGPFTMTVTAPGCTGNVAGSTSSLVVNQLPTSVVPTSTPNPVCVGNTITLNGGVSGGTGLVYAWTGNTAGIASASSENTTIPAAVLGNAGAYSLTVTAPGCTGFVLGVTAAQAVNQLPSAVAPTATPNPVCVGGTITLNGAVTGGSGLVYAWSGPISGIASASSVNTTIPTAVLGNAGVYEMTVTAPGCTGDVSGSTSSLVVNQLPSAVAPTATPNPVCVGNTITLNGGVTGGTGNVYAWSGPTTNIIDAAAANTTIPAAILANTGVYSMTVTAPGCAGSIAGATSALVVNQLPSAVAPTATPNPVCVGGMITLNGGITGGTGNIYVWSGPITGITDASAANTDIASAVLANTGTYSLTVTAPGCAGSVSGTASMVVNELPSSISPSVAPNPACVGGAILLNGGVTGGTGSVYAWSGPTTGITDGTVANATIPSAVLTNAGTYSLVVTAPGCAGSVSGTTSSLVVNQLPASVAPVASPTPLCEGNTIVLTGNVSGGVGNVYSWSGPITGIVDASLPNTTIPSAVIGNSGTYSLTVTAPGCVGNVTGATAAQVVNTLPIVQTFTGGGGFCVGDPGVSIGLTLTEVGVNYQLFTGGTPQSSPIAGTGAAITFGTAYNVPGYYYAIATNATSNCTSTLPGVTVIMNPLPDVFNVTGGGSYCSSGGAGVLVGLDNSEVGVDYQLYDASATLVATVPGTGAAISFGLQPAGTYTAMAMNVATGCMNAMTGSVTVDFYPSPNVYNVLGGGTYCLGGAGVNVSLDGSDAGIDYQLVYGGFIPIGGSEAGTGSALDMGDQFLPGDYTIIATDATTGCTSEMAGDAQVNFALPPTFYFVGGGGSYCAGDAGVSITLSGSSVGVDYQLYDNTGAAVGSALPGTGSPLDFGLFTNVGTYTVRATDMATGCTSDMFFSATVSVNPVVVPTVSLNTGVGADNRVCFGNTITFTAVTTDGGTTPTYEWKINNITVPAGDTYTYIPTDGDVVWVRMTSSSACAIPAQAMDTMYVDVDTVATPSVFITADPLTSVAPGTTVTLTATVTNGGPAPTFQWFKNGVAIAGANSAVYSSNAFANQDSMTVRVVTSGGCGGVETFNGVRITVYRVGVTDIPVTLSDVRLVPNPNKGVFSITGTLSSGNDAEVTVDVVNMLGQSVYKGKVMARKGEINEQIQLTNNLANGMYMLNLQSGNDHKVFHFVLEQ